MTAQIADSMLLDGTLYSIIGLRGGELPSPEDYGLQPVMIHTACWRGWYATYAVEDDWLVLSMLTVNDRDGNYPPLDGIMPEHRSSGGEAFYEGLHIRTAFTGRMLLGADFIQRYYVHMGFQDPWGFEKLAGLHVEAGRVVRVVDRSAHAAEAREALEDAESTDRAANEATNLVQWIRQRFALDYDDNWMP
jgi:hypothetical protein